MAGHGCRKLPAAQNKMAVVTVQAGSGSGTYARLFDDPARFPALLKEAETKAGVRFRPRAPGRMERRMRGCPADSESA